MTPAGTSNELDVQNGWEENTHTHTYLGDSSCPLPLLWCPWMAIVVSVQYNGGFSPDIILLTQFYILLPSGNSIECHEELSLQPMFQPELFDNFSTCLFDWVDAQKVQMRSDFFLDTPQQFS